jgi:hypothetical protein
VQLQVSVWNAATPDPAHLAGTLQFTGLPAGAVVHSCQGYDLPVPTRVESWGRVKALYR